MLLEAENITREYTSGEGLAVGLLEVTVRVNRFDFLLVTGQSGSGKTTLLNILSGLDFPSEGEVYVQGESLSAMAGERIALIRNETFGFIFQIPHLLPDRTVLENVMLPFHYGRTETYQKIVERCRELLDYIGLSHMADRYPNTLSGGEMQRVVAARAMARQPKIIFADEPTGSLDSENSERLVTLLQRQAKAGCAVVMVTHDTGLLHYGTHHLSLEKR